MISGALTRLAELYSPVAAALEALSFRGSNSTDSDNDNTTWTVDFDDSTIGSGDWNTAPLADVTHEYDQRSVTCSGGVCNVTLAVTDSGGRTHTDTVTSSSSTRPPTDRAQTSAPNGRWTAKAAVGLPLVALRREAAGNWRRWGRQRRGRRLLAGHRYCNRGGKGDGVLSRGGVTPSLTCVSAHPRRRHAGHQLNFANGEVSASLRAAWRMLALRGDDEHGGRGRAVCQRVYSAPRR